MYNLLFLAHYFNRKELFMSRHKVEICGVNTANIKVLSNEEMIQLFQKFHQGDLSAKEQLIQGNLKLVLSILKKFNHRVDNMDDLFQVGCIGLIKAIEHFDLSYEVIYNIILNYSKNEVKGWLLTQKCTLPWWAGWTMC